MSRYVKPESYSCGYFVIMGNSKKNRKLKLFVKYKNNGVAENRTE